MYDSFNLTIVENHLTVLNADYCPYQPRPHLSCDSRTTKRHRQTVIYEPIIIWYNQFIKVHMHFNPP